MGQAIPFLADAVSYAASMISKLLIKSHFQDVRVDTDPRSAREGLRWVWERPFFRLCSLLFAGSNPIFSGLYLLIVVLAKRGGASAASVGVMLAVAAAGGLVGAMLAPHLQRRLSPRTVLIGENWVMALGIPVMLVTGEAVLLGLIMAAIELITPVTNSIVVAFRVALTPDRLQGRVQGASTLISFSAGCVGPLLVGFLLERAGATATILTLSGWAAVLALGATASRSFRHPPQPHGASAPAPAMGP